MSPLRGLWRPHLSSTIALVALLCISAGAPAQDVLSGRLFTSPEQRAKLNQARKLGYKVDENNSGPQSDKPLSATVDGIVTRSSGNTTTWINSVAQPEGQHNATMSVLQQPGHDPAILIKTDSGKRVRLKVGDTVDMQTGAVRKVYESSPNDSAQR